jgi:hypothetical protein
MEETLSGARAFEDTMGSWQHARDERVRSMYEFTCELAMLQPPPPEMPQLLGIIRGNQRVPGLEEEPEWKNVSNSQPTSDILGMVGTIAEYAVRTTPGSSSFACNGGIASTSGKASCESCRLAPVRRTASGVPRRRRSSGCSRSSPDQCSTRSHNASGSRAAGTRSRYFADKDRISEVLLHPPRR